MKVSGWAAVTFATLLVFGNGAYFSWQQSQLQRRTSQIDEVVKLNQLEKDVGDIFHSIVDLTENYIRARDEYAKAPNPELLRKYTELNAELNLLKDRYANLERVLAKLQNRPARPISLEFTPLQPPSNLSVAPN